MKIDAQMVDYVAVLAKLRLDDERRAAMEHDLNDMLNYMEILNTLDTEGVEPVTHACNTVNVWREDVVQTFGNRTALQRNAIEVEDGCIKVPQTVE